MGNISSIYLDEETSSLLAEKKKNDPNFNLSAFIKTKLSEVQERRTDPSVLRESIAKREVEVQNMKNLIDFEKEQLRKIELEISMKSQNEEQAKLREQRAREDNLKRFADNLIYFFKDVDVPLSRKLAEEFYSMDKDERGDMWAFAKAKGLVDKPKEEMK